MVNNNSENNSVSFYYNGYFLRRYVLIVSRQLSPKNFRFPEKLHTGNKPLSIVETAQVNIVLFIGFRSEK